MASIKGSADVVVIGGGVIGLSIARALAKRGVRDVWLLERSHVGSEASSAAGGMLLPQVEADGHDGFFALACRSRDLYPLLAAEMRDETETAIELDPTGTPYPASTNMITKISSSDFTGRRAWDSRSNC